MCNDAFLTHDLDEQQSQAVYSPRGPLCIIAGAGTGKTRTITYRIAALVHNGHIPPKHILALTFTSKAATEMHHRLEELDNKISSNISSVQTLTFHTAAYRQLKYFWNRDQYQRPWRLLTDNTLLIFRAIHQLNIDLSHEYLVRIAEEINWAKSQLIHPDYYAQDIEGTSRNIPIRSDQLVDIYHRYEELKNNTDTLFLDFNDLLAHSIAIIEHNPHIAEEYRDRYRCFIVDEYQDISPLQQRLLNTWRGNRDDLTVVGDPHQTIYSFTGATSRYLCDFPQQFPHSRIIYLNRNYRSSQSIVSLSNKIIATDPYRFPHPNALVSHHPNGPIPRLCSYPDISTEVRQTIHDITALIHQGTPLEEIAILYRTNNQSSYYKHALSQAGIPWRIHTHHSSPSSSSIVSVQLINLIKQYPQRFPESLIRSATAFSSSRDHTVRSREDQYELTDCQHNNLLKILDQEISTDPSLNFSELLTRVERYPLLRELLHTPAVTLSSLHSAKGLEWDAVFLIGLTEGIVPLKRGNQRNNTQEFLDEERRLLYVGITRARTYLKLSWLSGIQPDGSLAKPSRFLREILSTISPELQ